MKILNFIKLLAAKRGLKHILALILIVLCFTVGILYEKISSKIDSPIEQIAEDVLEDYGFHVDFSEGKKEILQHKDMK